MKALALSTLLGAFALASIVQPQQIGGGGASFCSDAGSGSFSCGGTVYFPDGGNNQLGWQFADECDLTAEASQTMATNGNYTFCGHTWTRFNAASDSTAMAIINGTGLKVCPIAATDLNTTSTLPYIALPLTTILPTLTNSTAVRFEVYADYSTAIVNYDGAVMGIGRQDSLALWSMGMKAGNQGNPGTWTAFSLQPSNNGGEVFGFFGPNANTNPVMRVTDFNLLGGYGYFEGGPWSTTWPNDASFLTVSQNGAGTPAPIGALHNEFPEANQPPFAWISFFMGAQRAGSTTANFCAIFKRYRIETLRNHQ